jgi:hypothetical protein
MSTKRVMVSGALLVCMNEGALNLVDYLLPDVPLRQFVFTVPFPLRFLLAFDGALLGYVVRIFVDTVIGWYGRRHVERGLPPGESGAVAVIQRANSGQQAHPALSPELFIKTFGFEIVCQKCQSPLALIALIKNGDIAKKILTAMHLPSMVPELHPARPPPQEAEGGGENWVN